MCVCGGGGGGEGEKGVCVGRGERGGRCVCVCVRVCMCTSETETERERERRSGRRYLQQAWMARKSLMSIFLCLPVCCNDLVLVVFSGPPPGDRRPLTKTRITNFIALF